MPDLCLNQYYKDSCSAGEILAHANLTVRFVVVLMKHVQTCMFMCAECVSVLECALGLPPLYRRRPEKAGDAQAMPTIYIIFGKFCVGNNSIGKQ